MRLKPKHIAAGLLAFAGFFTTALAQQRAENDTTMLNDVEISSDNSLRRARPDTTLIDDVDEALPAAPGQSVPAEAVPGQPTGRWIGVGVAPIPDVLKAHLNLADGQGVMVGQVVPDSPAARAGLRQHDVLTSAGGVAVTDAHSLVNAVQSATASLELKWLRAGQEIVADVTPAERPKSLRLGQQVPVDPQDLGRLRDWIGRLEQGRTGANQGRMKMRFAPQGNTQQNQQVFQNNIEVQIQRQNDEPAKIKVQKDGDTWELTENDLDQLPDDVRGQVESMLGNGPQIGFGGLGGLEGLQGLDGLPNIQQLLEGMGGFPDFENQFDQMNQQMDRLFDEMRELRTQQRQLIPADQLEEGDEA